jgi:TatD DNase family protein
MWFRYQLRLADRLKLPLILHIRNADRYALPILKRYQSRLHGGVVHCFSGNLSLAEEYISLGFGLGIGGKLLCNDEQGNILRETVRSIPLESILIETDAPYVLPDRETLNCNKKPYGKLRNSSMLLPMILRKIAELRDEDYEAVERAVFQNAVRTFQLNV